MTAGTARPDRLLSNSLLCGWLVPASLLILPFFTFLIANVLWMLVAAGSVIAALFFARAAESKGGSAADAAIVLPPPAQCRRAVYVFSLMTIAGAMLILIDQQQTLGLLDISNLQQRYIELSVVTGEGERLGTWLSTVGNFLRAVVYIAVVAMVAYSKQVPGLRRSLAPGAALVLALTISEIATASRTYVAFCLVLAIAAGFSVRHRLIRHLGILVMLGVLAVLLFSMTTAQRLEARQVDLEVATEYLMGFFEVQMLPLGQLAVDWLGAPFVVGLLYMSHSVPEFSYLVAKGSSTLALGSHSLYLVFAPIMRLVGIEPAAQSTALAERGGMWWGMLGDLYLDFGLGFIVAYPLLILLMIRVSQRLGQRDVFTLAIRCLTATMFFCSPFFGVLNSYSFTYLLLLGLAALNIAMQRRAATRPHTPIEQS
jgi:hypothetical protein